ncbi:M20 peptidase aminoacylase family protein [Ectobacillus antri]|uniref:M20 peptidase aminoacylase family protein n=1 Tax=Ectobacillus antri TaxID=2486280 RepID=A0ABT6HAC5_9BACI|nr:M20 peptidase aminoacylase family protein [Ectobacillus antri]MDG4658450.1 M20 peptidase aminoacylase family protein [Ectobacillus antri]MDG5755471.1 M20 peptidase aminoacylase family protein [Ectobacillus antri]
MKAPLPTTTLSNLEEKLVAIRRHLHQYPELSNEEFETTKYIRQCLEEADITILETELQTGLIAEISGDTEGPIIALRADIDALPVNEQSGLPFASKIPGKMHACGHDFHTAAMIGAAYLLKQKEHALKGTVRFIFQPAEENGGGAKKVISAGLLTDVQAIFGMHNKPDLPVGTIGIKQGALMSGVDRFEIEVQGMGTHAAVPDAGIDPIVAASHIVIALQSIVSRNLSPFQHAVISVANVHAGTTWNVIPANAMLEGTVRTFDENVRATIPTIIRRVIDVTASAYGAQAKLHWYAGPPPVQNDAQLTTLAAQAAEKIGLTIVEATPSMAGEDFAFYQKDIPGSFVFMGTSGTEEWHHPAFTVDERALPISAQYFATLAIDTLQTMSKDL